MAINWSKNLVSYCQNVFSVPITVYPIRSQPDGAASYAGRGILHTREFDVMTEDGGTYGDQETTLDIRTREFPIPPVQKDRISIPFDDNEEPFGEFEVMKTSVDGGGEMTLVIRKIV